MIMFSIALTTEDRLTKAVVAGWYHTVVENLPDDMTVTVHQPDSDAVVVVRRDFDGHHYLVPLFRNISEDEAEKVVNAFVALSPDLDFDITVSAEDRMDGDDDIEIDQETYAAICAAWAKRRHDTWVKERTDNGWRYGTDMSLSQKTHPLLRPWADLPEPFKKIDADEPKELLSMLNDSGYAVLSQGELSSIMTLLRSFT